MHIITGLVIAGIGARMRQNKALCGLPRFQTGPIRVAHAVPGRIRFVAPSLKGCGAASLEWAEEFRKVRGIVGLDVNTVTGSVVVRFDPASVDPPLLFGVLARFLGLEEEVEKRATPAVVRELRALGKGINLAVYDNTNGMIDAWTLLVLTLAVIGTRKLAQTGWAGLPTGFTLLWWALNGLSRDGGGRS